MSVREMYTFREMTVDIGKSQHKLFLQDGFYDKSEISDVIHHHKYAEVHLVLGGDILYSIGERQYRATDGTMLVIPPGEFHAGRKLTEGALRAAFQIDAEVESLSVWAVGHALISALFSEIDRARESEDYTGIAAYATLLCRHFVASDGVRAERLTDYAFLIHEFFSHRYAEDVTLADLAGALHLSERQTERLVYKHTGGSFRDELSRSRLRVAARLVREGEMPLGEIASYVGYRSYAGFWKAMKKEGLL